MTRTDLEDASRYVAPIRDLVWPVQQARYRDEDVAHRLASAPGLDVVEQGKNYEPATGAVSVSPISDPLALGSEVVAR